MVVEGCTANTSRKLVFFEQELLEQLCFRRFISSGCYYSSLVEDSSHLGSLLLRQPIYRISAALPHLGHPSKTSFSKVSLVSKKWQDQVGVLDSIHLKSRLALSSNRLSFEPDQVAFL